MYILGITISIGWKNGWKTITDSEITPEILLRAYSAGIFPMSESADADDLFWVDPDMRGIIPLDQFHVSKSLRKRLFTGRYQFTANQCFEEVMQSCAARENTWINDKILKLYGTLNEKGFAHSIEVWRGKTLVGGLYGVCLASAFFGESMFSAQTDGSKLALIGLLARLNAGGFKLLDTQFMTDHLISLGGVEIPRDEYHLRLANALQHPADFWKLDGVNAPQELWQLSTQTS